MKIFTDSQLKNELQNFDLGIVRAGENKIYEYYIYNETNAMLTNIECEILHPEVKILSVPKSLTPKVSGKLVIEWKPAVTLKQGLKSLFKFKASELWS